MAQQWNVGRPEQIPMEQGTTAAESQTEDDKGEHLQVCSNVANCNGEEVGQVDWAAGAEMGWASVSPESLRRVDPLATPEAT